MKKHLALFVVAALFSNPLWAFNDMDVPYHFDSDFVFLQEQQVQNESLWASAVADYDRSSPLFKLPAGSILALISVQLRANNGAPRVVRGIGTIGFIAGVAIFADGFLQAAYNRDRSLLIKAIADFSEAFFDIKQVGDGTLTGYFRTPQGWNEYLALDVATAAYYAKMDLKLSARVSEMAQFIRQWQQQGIHVSLKPAVNIR